MVKKKRSPKEIIESRRAPRFEEVYIKFPGEEIIKAPGLKGKGFAMTIPFLPLRRLREKSTDIHTHYTGGMIDNYLPTGQDFDCFLTHNYIKTMIVAQQNEAGKVEGYFVFRKTKKTPPIYPKKVWSYFSLKNLINLSKKSTQLEGDIEKYDGAPFHKPKKALKEFCNKYKLNYKFLPAKDYEISKEFEQFEKIGKRKNLESKLSSIIVIGSIAISLIFFSSTLTGFTISNLTQQTSNAIGIILFIIGLIGSLYYFKKRK